MGKEMGKRKWGMRGLGVALVVACGLLIPSGASAFTDGTTYSLEIKVLPSKFKSGTQLDIPVYLVENRSPANGGSQLAEYNLGGVDSSFSSSQSKFIQFTPAPGLIAPEIIAQENPWIIQNGPESLVQFRFESPGVPGLAVTPDNSGIVGRTEVLIGTVRTEIGPAIPQTSGLPIVFEMTVKPSGGSSGVEGMTDGGGQPGLGDIPTSQIQVFADPPEDPDDPENAACEKAQAKVKMANKTATRAKKNAAKAAARLKKAKKSKKAAARKQSVRARKNANKAKEALRRSRTAAKAACTE